MNNLIVAFVVVFAGFLAVCTAYPSYGYHGDFSDDYHYDYDGFGYGYERNHHYWQGSPRFGAGYDRHVYGPYKGHPGPYDYYGKIYSDYHGKDYSYDHKAYGYEPKDHYTPSYAYGYTHGKY